MNGELRLAFAGRAFRLAHPVPGLRESLESG
jgi:hypothetical protein